MSAYSPCRSCGGAGRFSRVHRLDGTIGEGPIACLDCEGSGRDDTDLAYSAWCVIANVSNGNWDEQTQEWRDAAIRWRDQFHATLEVA